MKASVSNTNLRHYYKASLFPGEFNPTCAGFQQYLRRHLATMENNPLVQCVSKSESPDAPCLRGVRDRLADDTKDHRGFKYGDEDCHLIPVSAYTRSCENVFKLERFQQDVLPFLKSRLVAITI